MTKFLRGIFILFELFRYTHVVCANDHAPYFKNVQNVTVSEDETRGFLVTRLEPSDDDPGLDGETVVTIEDDADGLFMVTSDGGVYLAGTLDYETIKFHTVIVKVKDKSLTVVRSSIATLTVTVENVVDALPICQQKVFVRKVRENYKNSVVFRTTDVCYDPEDNGLQYYPIKSLTLSLDPSTNVFEQRYWSTRLYMRSTLDYERDPRQYLFKLSVIGRTLPRRTITIDLIVLLTDVNDEPVMWPNGNRFNISIPEYYSPYTKLITAEAWDDVRQIQYGIIENPPGYNFVMTNEGELYSLTPFDREHSELMEVQIYARDYYRTKPKLPAYVTITVTDVNDNAPIFNQIHYFASFFEDQDHSSTALVLITASDADAGQNAEITYSMQAVGGDQSAAFRIDSQTGGIYASGSYVKNKYSFTVTARDGGSPSLATTVTLDVVIRLANKHDPHFESSPYQIHVAEDAGIGTTATTVNATDDDIGMNGDVLYTMTPNIAEFVLFAESGDIIVQAPLDREIRSEYVFALTATDRSITNKRNHTTTLIITIDDLNDNRPECIANSLVKMDSPVSIGDTVSLSTCVDRDEGSNAKLQYSIISGNLNSDFGIDIDTGTITIVKSPTFSLYRLTCEVNDNGSPPLRTTYSVEVIVAGNQFFENLPFSLHLNESNVISVIVYTVDGVGYPGPVTYAISSGDDDSIFAIDYSTGDLYNVKPLDRETSSGYNLTIEMTDVTSKKSIISYLTIGVNDVNDNAPKFDKSFYVVKILENVGKAHNVLSLSGTDNDIESQNNDVNYILTNDRDGTFEIDNNGNIKTVLDLDREVTASYILTVLAYDRGIPTAFTSSVSVFIEVIDYNEHPPMFSIETGEYETTLSEYTAVGDAVLDVNATDADKSALRYYITEGNHNNIFVLNEINGRLHIVKKLDRETTVSHVLNIKVVNEEKEEATGKITINVLDENDNDPTCTEFLYQSDLLESAPIGNIVQSLVCNDEDINANANLIYTITSGNLGNHYKIVANTIITDSILYYSQVSHYSLIVEVKDGGSPPRSTNIVVNVKMIPIIAPPKFQYISRSMTIPEDFIVGNVIYDCDATFESATEGTNGSLSYEIVYGNVGNAFHVVADTGEILLNRKLDYDAGDGLFNLKIKAESKLNSTAVDFLDIELTINDVNDNYPEFDNEFYQIDFSYKSGESANVATFKATDEDSSLNSEIEYSISGPSDFTIGLDSGIVTSADSLESQDGIVYLLTVTASDKGTPKRKRSVNVYVTIVDNTNHAPVFSEDVYLVKVREDINSGVIFIISVVDVDKGNNGMVEYSILGGNSNNEFGINAQYGHIFINGQLDRENIDTYELTVSAKDFGNPSLKTNTTVRVEILDVNDNAPKFTNESYSSTISITTPLLTNVVECTADDADIGIASEFACRLLPTGNENGFFVINPYSGVIKTTSSLVSAVGEHNLVVECSDYGNPVRSSQVGVTIIVNNDRALPKFAQASLSAQISEGNAPGKVIFNANATDSGAFDGAFGSIRYAIIGDDTGIWNIDPHTGEVSANIPLNREANVSTYSISVRASDTFDASRSDTMNLKIYVGDINDNAPIFVSHSYAVDVGHGVMGQVVTVEATDADEGDNAEVQYTSITGDGAKDFALDIKSGEIYTVITPDRYRQPFYVLRITAQDYGIPVLQSTAFVYVTVVEADNTVPYFTSELFDIYVKEDALGGNIVFALTAIDRDTGQNGVLQYSIIEGNVGDAFSINSSTGIITLASNLDYETKSDYSLKIEVKDNAATTLKAFTVINVHVINVNDNEPVFVDIPVVFQVSSDLAVGVQLGYIKATDKDNDTNYLITYAITNGNSQSLFNIHAYSGVIRTSTSLIGYSGNYTLIVTAKDSDIAPKIASVSVSILVEDSTKNRPPSFSHDAYNVNVRENIESGTVIFCAVASDLDAGRRGEIRYSLTAEDNGVFEINVTTGCISVIGSIDREITDKYELNINATDLGETRESTSIKLTVSVIDENDNYPKFVPRKLLKTLYPFLVDGSVIIELNASDADLGENSKIFYSIAKGDGPFKLDSVTGILVTTGDLRSKAGIYDLVILAKDSGIPSKTSVVDLRVEILSAVADQSYTVDENLPASTSLGFIRTSLTGPNRTFVIESGSGLGRFDITAGGNLITTQKLDADDDDELFIKVLISDNNNPPSTQSLIVQVMVEDLNDNKPKFHKSPYVTSIPERQAPGTVALNFLATDRDVSESRYSLSYAIYPPEIQNTFILDARKRQIKIKTPPVFKTKSQYNFKLTVTDNGSPKLSNTVDVTINIDESPVVSPFAEQCSKSVYIADDLPFNSEKNAVVHTLTPEQFDLNNYKVTSIKYVTFQGDKAPFKIYETSGQIVVSNTALLYKNTRYLFWIVAQATTENSGDIASLAMVRLDTFIPNDHVVIVDHGLSEVNMKEVSAAFATKLSDLISGVVKIWKITGSNLARKRRELLATESLSYIYAVKNPTSEQLTGLETSKSFFTQEELTSYLTLSTLQSPDYANYSVNDVSVYDIPNDDTIWASTPVGIAVITIIVLAIVFLILAIVVYFWCTSPRQRRRSESVESLRKADDVSVLDVGITPFAPLPDSKSSMFPHYHRVPSPKPHKTVTLDGTQYDGRAHDAESGRPYLFNSATGERRFVTEDELDLYLANNLPHKTPPPYLMPPKSQPHLKSSSIKHVSRAESSKRKGSLYLDNDVTNEYSDSDGNNVEKTTKAEEILNKTNTIHTYFKPLPKDANRLRPSGSYPDIRTRQESPEVVNRKTKSITPHSNAGTFSSLKNVWRGGKNKSKSRKPQVIVVKNEPDGVNHKSASMNLGDLRDNNFVPGSNSSQIPYAVQHSWSATNLTKLSPSPRLATKVGPFPPAYSPKIWKGDQGRTSRQMSDSRTDSAYSSVIGESYT